jgi:hypothetical protein
MNDQIIVIDDVISKGHQDFVEKELLTYSGWRFLEDVAYSGPGNDTNYDKFRLQGKTPAIGHQFFDKNYGGIQSPIYMIAAPIIHAATDSIGQPLKELLAGRIFMHFPLAESLKKTHDNIHIDFPFEHMACVYYVNDTDGDTFIFDKFHRDLKPNQELSEVEFNIVQRVTPKKGRCVVFNGSQFHSSSGPTDKIRCIINFDFLV